MRLTDVGSLVRNLQGILDILFRDIDVAQLVQCSLNTQGALGSIPRTT